ncbi:Nif11-like leader peptide family RiPP precursor [Oceanibaculum indicum]|uniref:Nif11 domain-containing protein n=1 Tax=Oceanibaculum indicum P24 TaxID=1207063 RepID=K2KMJ7_9PROT|nr:Nif11-like leader peptide family RiPP precursor [Oceanibaculum indicum]EKE78690.1 hypothetical protein P24_00025 [Oceanibaculum indicum P24]
MSKAEMERFLSDLANDADLADAVRSAVRQPADLAAFATQHGYAVEGADIEQVVHAASAEGGALSDEQLEAVAGGTAGRTAFEIIQRYLLDGDMSGRPA